MLNINSYKSILFDLDNTLYADGKGPINEVEERMNDYFIKKLGFSPKEANDKRLYFHYRYGSTVNGLKEECNFSLSQIIDFLEYSHNVNITNYLKPDKRLNELLSKIKPQKFIVTNSYKNYAIKVLEQLGILEYFSFVFDVIEMNFLSKSSAQCFYNILSKINSKPEETIFIDDAPEYLQYSKAAKIFTIKISHRKNNYNFTPDLELDNIYELEKYIF
ncbi:MAG TPA: HAD hydrolase-like protein [bacterium]|nr:HAD hydrolase-like protein [bacterium]HPQ19900.1 HAD hydrolase-like protein [bacterium]